MTISFPEIKYSGREEDLIFDTIQWLIENQKDDGGYSPWKLHPVDSDVYCTSLASMGLLQYQEMVDPQILQRIYAWLTSNQLNSGIWKFHEIEDGASWGLYALVEILKSGVLKIG